MSTSGSWPALGEMSQKAKREDERSPPSAASSVLSSVEQSSSAVAPSSAAAAFSQERFLAGEKKPGGLEGVSPNELLDLEQQKLAGKKKGLCNKLVLWLVLLLWLLRVYCKVEHVNTIRVCPRP